jgi:8-oxo-dGTP diphosphatase
MAKARAEKAEAISEERFLAEYKPEAYPRPAVTVDIVVFTIVDADLRVLLVRRGEHPHKGRWALPGGFVRVGSSQKEQGEDLDEAAARELAEETGLPRGAAYLEQLRAFGKSGRDPRMRVISIGYFALVRPTLVPLVRAGGDVDATRWFRVESVMKGSAEVGPLAFDHKDILDCALTRARAELETTGVAFELVPETFTIPELRAVHEAVRGEPLDAGNFRKRFHRMLEDGFIQQAPGKRVTASKPAKVYRFVRR